MPRTHYLSDEHVHYKWDTDNEPALIGSIPATRSSSGPGTSVTTRSARDSDASALATFDWDRTYPLTGPIAVHGAEPGDTLKIEILDVHTQGWGWTGVIPGFGLLLDGVPGRLPANVRPFARRRRVLSREDIAIPLEPYFGTMGVCPAGANDTKRSFRPGASAATWTSASSVRGPRCICRSRSRRRCSPAATPTEPRATARSAAPRSSRRCSPRCGSRSRRAARSRRRSTARLRL